MAGVDKFGGSPQQTVGAAGPATDAAPVVMDADLPFISRALIIGTGGDLKVITKDGGGVAVLLPGVPAGVLPLRVVRVVSAGTTATNISALW